MNEHRNFAPLNRIPGSSQVKEQHCKDLKSLTRVQLLEMRDRQGHFISSTKRLHQLPDKGKRLLDSYAKLLDEIKRRDEVEEATRLLSGLNIAEKGKVALNNLEWNGRTMDEGAHVDDILDSDDEVEMDPLRIIAQGTMHEKRVKVLPPPESLITAADLADIEEFKKPSHSPDSALAGHSDTSSQPAEIIDQGLSKEQHVDQHALYLIDKTEGNVHPPAREKFRPFRTTTSNVHDPDKERVRKKGKHWEVTAATPPLIQHKEVQLVPLAESAALQLHFMQKIKELRIQQAEQRLAKLKESRNYPDEAVIKSKESFRHYRNPQPHFLIEGRPGASESNEVQDPTIQDKATGTSGIHYTVFE
ncbi:uncharacterized protein LOC110188677 [Drosophila serrata]|uniref:uncharacterized protein LOC110188677 n=1 Tax=Drosophila serrata TaxID=7274 RepID=UPI000A1D1B13|nr:uncharacterized protein LOC110188677 [Drosophila serrata]